MERKIFIHPRPYSRFLALTAAALCALPLLAQPKHPWTVPEIWGTPGSPTGDPPRGMVWSPDGKHVTWIGDHGNLMEIEPPGVKPEILLPAAKIASLLSAPIPERARDHRARYGEPDYIWSPDSRHILFDTNGELWLFDLSNGTGVQIGNTGMASGDNPKFSPSGQYVSYLRDHNLYVLPADGSRPATALTNSHDPNVLDGEVDWVYLEELDARSNYFWSPDSKQIAFLQMNETQVPQYPLVDWIPVHAAVHEQRYPQPGDPNPAVRVGVVSAGGGSTRWLRVPLQEGDDYIPRFGWVNSRVVWVETLSRSQQHLDLWFADSRTGQIALALAQTEPKYFDTTYDVRFVGGNQFLILSWRDGHTHIYRYTFNGANPLAASAELADQLESGDYEVSSIAGVDPDTQTVWYLSNQDHPRQQQIWAVGLDSSNRHQISQIPGVHRPDFAPQGGYFVDTYSSMTAPPTVAECDGAGDCTPFWNSTPLRGHKLIAPVLLTLTAADRLTTLYGTLLLPPDKTDPRSVPLIVNPYGGPDVGEARDAWGGKMFFFDQLLAQHGFAVLHVDNRGMGGRGRAFEQVCWHNFGPPQFADQMAAIDQVLRRYPQLDPHRLGWWGWSWGGSFTLFALSHSDSFLAGVSVAPVTDWRDYDSIYTERYMGLPSEDADNYTADSDVTSAAHLHGHILIMHGTGDDNVHIENTIQYIQQLIDARIPYDLNLFPRKTHSIAGPDDRTVLFEQIVDQFERYLMNPPPEDHPERAERDRRR
ncbi:MAG TPA: alpha/beta fold hydrolase [Acidobacteriaceae bacterium]|nr:alpha/beta fold hydrolase [Acidobacteriaceae bacterium]